MWSTSRMLGQLLDRGALSCVVLQQGPYGVRDLAPAAVADSDVDQAALHVAGAVGGVLEQLGRAVGQQVEGADRVEPPPARGREVLHHSLDDGQERQQLLLGPVEVVGRQQPERDDLDAELVAPPEERLDVGGTGAPAGGLVGAGGLGPAPVAVEHDADVLGQGGGAQLPHQPRLVGGVQHALRRVLEGAHGLRVATPAPLRRASWPPEAPSRRPGGFRAVVTGLAGRRYR